MTRKELALAAVAALKAEYPDARCSLDYETPLQLLIATRLSAQCTDARVNHATIKKAFMRSAKKVILAVDNTKFDKTSFVRFANIGEIDAVITDKEPSDEWKNYFASNNVELYY